MIGAAVGTAIVNPILATPASAAVVTVVFPDVTTGFTATSVTATGGGLSLTADNPVGGPFPTAGGINSTVNGLCVLAGNNNPAGRCGYTTANASLSTVLTGVSFNFSKNVSLTGFTIGQISGLTSGSISFGGFGPVTVSSIGFNSLPGLFVGANTPFALTTSGIFSPTSSDGLLRILSIQVDDNPQIPVPGPLPLLGAASAFACSRRLRRRIKSTYTDNNLIG
jgi:hypothetical protein